MIRLYEDKEYHYKALFETKKGIGIRSDVLDEHGKETGIDPFRASYPHLLDIGIMGYCKHGLSGRCLKSGVLCYQSGACKKEEHMTLENFCRIIDESKDFTFQVALGGRGDPNDHPDFVAMIEYCHRHQVVPNFTTSGYDFDYGLLPEIKKYCGAVAVSWYRSPYTLRTISLLLSHGIKTNIHYVLSGSTLDEAIQMIQGKSFPSGVNRIIFLLHKPVGLGSCKEVLDVSDPRVKLFFSLFNQQDNCNIAGFDACSAPALLNFAERILPESYDTCEAGRFSAYISPDMKLYPCSFDQKEIYAVSLREHSIKKAWDSKAFDRFRSIFKEQCKGCDAQHRCLGGCPLMENIVLCDKKFRFDKSERSIV